MINYVIGDATVPLGTGPKIIAHVCNDVGAWGRGFVLAVTQKWPHVENKYRNWFQQNDPNDPSFQLGNVQFVEAESDIIVANMISQHGILIKNGVVPIRYDSLEECLQKTFEAALKINGTVHMPRIGCGLAGGSWSEVEKLVLKTMGNIQTYVYDFESNDARFVTWNP